MKRDDTPLTDEQKKLVEDNIGIAWKFASRSLRVDGYSFDDILSCAFDGLMAAARRYDPSKGRLSTYANRWMRAKLQNLATLRCQVSVPSYMMLRRGVIARTKPEHRTHDEAAAHLAVTAEARSVSYRGRDGLGSDSYHPSVYHDGFARVEAEDFVGARSRRLNEDELDVVVALYREDKLLREVAEKWGCTTQHVSYIHFKALAKMGGGVSRGRRSRAS